MVDIKDINYSQQRDIEFIRHSNHSFIDIDLFFISINYWGLAQLVERLSVKQNVIGSNPISPAIYGDNRTMVSTQVCDTWNMSSILIYHPNNLIAR